MLRVLREPLVHCIVAGAALFGAYTLINGGQQESDQKTQLISVSVGDVTWLAENWTRQWRRPPTQEELRGLVTDYIDEQLLAHEARSLGLEADDIVIRRRLAQKLLFVVEDTSRRTEPTGEELRRFYEGNRERFRTNARISFAQVFFNATSRADAAADATNFLRALRASDAETPPLSAGDRTLFGTDFHGETVQSVSSIFGPDFARAVFTLTPGSWSGPVQSAYGQHLVHLRELRQSEIPPLDDVRDRVLAEWRADQEKRAKSQYLAALQKKYKVVIEEMAASPRVDAAMDRPAQ